MSATPRYRSDLPPIVASWPADNVWVIGGGTPFVGLPSGSGSWVSIALPPLRKDRTTLSEIQEGLNPEYVAFGRVTRTTAKFHAHLKAALTEFSTVGLVARAGSAVAEILVFERPTTSQVAITVGATRSAQLLALQVREIWEHSTLAHRNWQQQLGPNGLLELSPSAFERLVTSVFQSIGAEARHTGSTGDGGVDAEFSYDNKLFVVQCKRFKTPVGPGPIRELIGSTVLRNAALGIMVSTSGYTQAARASAQGQPIRLLGPTQLAALDASIFDTRLGFELPQRLVADARSASLSRAWPTPVAAGGMRLSSSHSTPQFRQLPPLGRRALVLAGIRGGLTGWSVVLIALGVWAFFGKTFVPLVLLPIVVGLAVTFGVRSRIGEEVRRGPTCMSCKHQSHAHALKAFSPYRLRLSCTCSKCDHLLPDPEADSVKSPAAKPLLYIVAPNDRSGTRGRMIIERSDDATGNRAWQRVADFPLTWGHALVTDLDGRQAISRYRYHQSTGA